jgi:predicted ribosome quality control (RQC) complex YloA/Tae2 family protein
MYHSYYFLSRLSAELNSRLNGTRLMECFSQEKDELILGFYNGESQLWYMKADFKQGSGILTFPSGFGRTRSNSVNLFQEQIGADVLNVRQTKNDRSFHLNFNNGLSLCFKMYGQRSNLILHRNGSPVAVFNNHLKKDLNAGIPEDRDLNLQKADFLSNPGGLRKSLPIFDKWMWQWWESHTQTFSPEKSWEFLQEMQLTMLNGPFLLCKVDKEVIISFFEMGEILEKVDNPLEASNRFYQYFWQVNQFLKTKEMVAKNLEQELFRVQQQIQNTQKQLENAEDSQGYRKQADLIMAFPHEILPGSDQTILPDFETGKPIEIKLKKDLSIPENAARLYKKAKGSIHEKQQLEQRLVLWKNRKAELSKKRTELDTVLYFKDLKPFLAEKFKKGEEEESRPYYLHEVEGFEIRVGKNAKSNDDLLRITRKDDLWLHARDSTGSHVVIVIQKGKKTPNSVIERAAELAAFHSKSKSDSLCPVMVTERKYVRKNKSMLPGQVRVEREKTILIKPKG